MRRAHLTTQEGGIDRLRVKGGARADSAYDLVNAFITEKGTVKQRPGTTRHANLPANTVGLTAFDGGLHVFSHTSVDLSSYSDYTLHILLHPTNPAATLSVIHFAKPYLGALYVIGEFSDGVIRHYWLQSASDWEANDEVAANEFRAPTTANGYVYRATRFGNPYPSWSAGVSRTAGNGSSVDPSIIEPSAYNEYYYTAVATNGDNPRSGSVEPTWPTDDGAQVIENTDGFESNATPTPPSPPDANQPQSTTTSRYS